MNGNPIRNSFRACAKANWYNVNKALSNDHVTASRTAKKPLHYMNNFARASRFFVHFFAMSLHDYDVKAPNFTFCGGREHIKTMTFFFFS